MFLTQPGARFMLQQVVSGTGVFDGSEYGRAKGTITNADPNAVVRISSRLYGSASNSYTIQFQDAGSGVDVLATTVTQTGSAIVVRLRRGALAGLQATAAEVANAINSTKTGIVATYGGSGNGVVAALGATAINSTASGADFTVRGNNQEQFLCYVPTNQNGGFFYFEQSRTVLVRQLEAKFTVSGGTHVLSLERVTLNTNLEAITSESIPSFVWSSITTSAPDIAATDLNVLLHPYQALRVITTTGLPGIVRLDVQV